MKSQSDPALKYVVWAEHLRHDIEAGLFRPGDRLPSLAQIKGEHGLSRSTADKAYSLLEQEGLVERRNGSGIYVSRPSASETGLIGIVGGDIAEQPRTPFMAHLLEGLQRGAQNANKGLVLLSQGSPQGWKTVEGVLFVFCAPDPAVESYTAGIPRVSLLRPLKNVISVTADEFEGGRLAAEHLLGLGHRRIAFLHYVDDPISEQRVSGYRNALREAGLTPVAGWERLFSNEPDETGTAAILRRGTRVMAEWLEGDWDKQGCTALVCQNDHVAIGAMKALHDAGKSVPGDVSVIGFDGTETGESCTPTLTSIRIPVEEIAEVGLETLREQLESGDKNARPLRTILLLPTLVERESTGPVAPAR